MSYDSTSFQGIKNNLIQQTAAGKKLQAEKAEEAKVAPMSQKRESWKHKYKVQRVGSNYNSIPEPSHLLTDRPMHAAAKPSMLLKSQAEREANSQSMTTRQNVKKILSQIN